MRIPGSYWFGQILNRLFRLFRIKPPSDDAEPRLVVVAENNEPGSRLDLICLARQPAGDLASAFSSNCPVNLKLPPGPILDRVWRLDYLADVNLVECDISHESVVPGKTVADLRRITEFSIDGSVCFFSHHRDRYGHHDHKEWDYCFHLPCPNVSGEFQRVCEP